MKGYDYLVVGAGFFGAVIAERLANELGQRVLVVDERNHIGGNCYSVVDKQTGIEFHEYGTHIFHTSNPEVRDYINKFTEFNGYRHQVLTTYRNKVYQLPINLETINAFYDINLKPYEAEKFLKTEIAKSKIKNPKNLEEKAISLIGKRLYEAFIKEYTFKQWKRDPKKIPASIIDRLPVRYNYNESYYRDVWQGIPLMGYSRIFERMLNSKNINVELNTDYFQVKDLIKVKKKIIYSGPVDRFFDYTFGKLEWRTVSFQKEIITVGDFQGTSVMNYSELKVPYTRIHEPKHLHEERNYAGNKTLILKEFSCEDHGEDPYYPIPDKRNENIYKRYKNLMKKEKKVIWGGRLADYKYYDMDQVISKALSVFEKIQRNQL